MDDQSNSNGGQPQRRRLSIAEMLNPRASTGITNPASSPPTGVPASPDTHHRRGLSISTQLGLTGTTQTGSSPYSAFARQRRASFSNSSASSSPEFRNSFTDENAVIEEDEPYKGPQGTPPSPSLARRVSFGAQALKDVRQSGGGNASNAGTRPSPSLPVLNEDEHPSVHFSSRSIESAKTRGEGFNWSEALRDRTKRSPSFSSGNPFSTTARSKSFAGPGLSSAAVEPPKEMPKAIPTPPKLKKPDIIGERMLRGEFMMD